MKKIRIRELAPGERAADAAALSVMFDGVPVGTIQRWAQADGWPRRHTTTSKGRRTEYSVQAACDTYERQRGPVDSMTSGEVTCGHVGDLSPLEVTARSSHQALALPTARGPGAVSGEA